MPDDADAPLLVLLPFLGATARQWDGVASRLAGAFRCLPLDLPGFGDAARDTRHTVAGMADAAEAAVRAASPARWFLAGHSMGGKVAAVVARRCEDGGVGDLAGLALLAASPPCPEPMDEAQRDAMASWFAGDAASRRGEARRYVEANAGGPLDPSVLECAALDVARGSRAAWVAWLRHGSREDWAERVGLLRTPTLVVAGRGDPALGPDTQRRLVLPHLAQARLEVIEGAGHLLPLERPEAVAGLIAGLLA